MGIKMGVALDSAGNEWGAETYVKGMGTPPLKCKFCLALVTHNASYPRERDEKSHIVQAYFRLLPGASHAFDCSFAVQKKIEKIAKESKELFESVSEGQYRLRLVIIKDELTKSVVARKPGQVSSRTRTGTAYSKSSGKLPAYINSAKRVLLIRAMCDDDEEISTYLQLVFEGNTIVPWARFYFETECHGEAFSVIRDNTVTHPLALHGKVTSKRIGVGKYRNRNVINLQKSAYRQNPEDLNNGVGYEVSIWSDDANWFNSIEKDDEVIVLALWNVDAGVANTVTGRRFNTYTTHKILTNLVLMSQIAKVPLLK
ncbi:hypothetical protein [Rhodoferax sp. GW822-FHT02A01]|uniref:hypothetical protein n=1 Tax=Rhodoferax sp. GW822-FHT02A01 TaxID=3141537 RepID=UPI00315D2E9D